MGVKLKSDITKKTNIQGETSTKFIKHKNCNEVDGAFITIWKIQNYDWMLKDELVF